MIYFLILNSVSGTVCARAIICIGVSQTLLQFDASPPGIQAVVKKSTENVPPLWYQLTMLGIRYVGENRFLHTSLRLKKTMFLTENPTNTLF